MIPSKPPKNESRRSSILKACKPRQPLQNVNINSSSNENSPTTSKVKRRVSFADKKHVKKFCNSMEQGTVWDMTYEDNCVDAAIEIASSPPYNHDLTCYLSDASTIEVFDDVKDDLDGITPIEHVDVLNQELPLRQVIPPQVSKSTSSNVDTIYTDRDKENYAAIISNVYYPKMYTSEVNSELDRTRVQDLSMEFTAMISAVYCDDKQKDVQKDNVTSHQDNLDTNCTMELTKVVSRRSEAENFDLTSKQENIYREKDMNSSITFTQKTSLLCKSMDITEVVSAPVSHENICNIDRAAEALISNCDNESMEITEAVPISVKPTQADMQAFRVTEFFRDTSMQMTKPIDTILSANVYNKENLRTDEPVLRENKDTFSYNTSMEMTEAILSRNREEMFDPVTHEKNIRGRQNNSITFNERTELLRKSMDITEAVSNPVEREKTYNSKNTMESTTETLIPYATTVLRTHLPTENSAGSPLHADPAVNNDETIDNISMEITAAVQSTMHRTENPTLNRTENLNVSRNVSQSVKPTQADVQTFRVTEFFRDASMQMTEPINTILSTNVYSKENLRTDEPVLGENRDTFSHNMSMEITEAVLSRNREEMFDPVTHEKNIRGRQNMNNSITFNERTELLRKSMDITEAVSNPVEREKTYNIKNIVESAETLIPYATTVLRTHLPTENSAGSPLHADPAVNNDETIDNISMEITAAVQSHRTESPTLNRTENLNVSRNESQCPTASNTAEFKKSETRENVQISRETTETTNLHDALSDTRISTNKLDHPLSATLTNAGKRMSSHENENTNAKKFCSGSFVECQLSAVRYNAHSSSRADDKYVSKERSTDDTIHPARTSVLPSESRASDSLNETDECSFLRQNLENSFIELLSINPPSFVCMSSQEENSMSKVLKEDELHASNTAEAVPINDKNHSSEQLEPTNIEYDETKDCHRNIVKNTIKNKRETEVIEKTIDDNPVDESNRYATDAEHLNEESTPSMSSLSRGEAVTVPDTDRFADTKVTRTDQVDEEEHIREEINDEVELRNMEQEEQHSKVEEECCADHLEETEATIEDRVDRDEYCQENSNGKVDPQSMEQRENYVKERPDTEQCVNKIEEESLVEQDPFLSLTQKLETYAESDDCIWSVYYKNVDRKMIAFGFISNSLLIVTFLSDNLNDPEENSIKRIKIVSRLAHDSSELSWIVHRLIMEKINMETLSSYRTHEDILPMLDFVSRDVILAMDFIFDLKSLDKLNLMEIARDKISFVTRSKNLDIILKITINVKRFDKLTPSDISIHRILGTIREEEVKYLIKNVRKDHKFLRRYMNDVRDYVDIMEQISVTSNSLGQIVKIRKNP